MPEAKTNKYQLSLFFIVTLIVLLHMATAFFPPVNMEFAFVAAKQYIETGERSYFDFYTAYQANTLGVPLVGYLINKVIPFIDGLAATRLGSIAGIPLLAYSVAVMARRFNLSDTRILLLVTFILTNPIVWVYSQRATADFLPVAVGMAGLALFLTKDTLRGRVLSAFILGFAIVLKYHAIFFLLVACLYWIFNEKSYRALPKVGLYGILASLIPATYIIFVKINFGFWVTPPQWLKVHRFTMEGLVSNFLTYCAYSTLLILPLSALLFFNEIKCAFQNKRWSIFAGIIFITLISLFASDVHGEMNFGPLDPYINPKAFLLISGFVTAVFVLILYKLISDSGNSSESNIFKAISLGILIFLCLLSFTRPSQRYLLFILPVLYLAIMASPKMKIPKYLAILTGSVYLSLSAFATTYQFVVGNAAQEMALKIEEAGLTGVTDPGAIEPHVGGFHFAREQKRAQYKIVQGTHDDAIIMVKKSAFNMVNRSYSLINRPPYLPSQPRAPSPP